MQKGAAEDRFTIKKPFVLLGNRRQQQTKVLKDILKS
jgi:hypothetical protein